MPGFSGQGMQVSPSWVKNVSAQRHWSFMHLVGPLYESQGNQAHVPVVCLRCD